MLMSSLTPREVESEGQYESRISKDVPNTLAEGSTCPVLSSGISSRIAYLEPDVSVVLLVRDVAVKLILFSVEAGAESEAEAIDVGMSASLLYFLFLFAPTFTCQSRHAHDDSEHSDDNDSTVSAYGLGGSTTATEHPKESPEPCGNGEPTGGLFCGCRCVLFVCTNIDKTLVSPNAFAEPPYWFGQFMA